MTNFRDSVVKSMNLVRKTWNMCTYDDHLHVQVVIFMWYFMKFILIQMLLLLLLLMLFKKKLNILKHVCLFSLKCLPVKSEFQRTAVCNKFHHSVDHSVHSAHHSADCHPGHHPGGMVSVCLCRYCVRCNKQQLLGKSCLGII